MARIRPADGAGERDFRGLIRTDLSSGFPATSKANQCWSIAPSEQTADVYRFDSWEVLRNDESWEVFKGVHRPPGNKRSVRCPDK
jgi:hypothetical protein